MRGKDRVGFALPQPFRVALHALGVTLFLAGAIGAFVANGFAGPQVALPTAPPVVPDVAPKYVELHREFRRDPFFDGPSATVASSSALQVSQQTINAMQVPTMVPPVGAMVPDLPFAPGESPGLVLQQNPFGGVGSAVGGDSSASAVVDGIRLLGVSDNMAFVQVGQLRLSVRVNYIVHGHRVTSIGDSYIMLDDGNMVPIDRSYIVRQNLGIYAPPIVPATSQSPPPASTVSPTAVPQATQAPVVPASAPSSPAPAGEPTPFIVPQNQTVHPLGPVGSPQPLDSNGEPNVPLSTLRSATTKVVTHPN